MIKSIEGTSGLASERKCMPVRLKECDPGYEVNDSKDACVDIDECSFIKCPQSSSCKNLPGSYACPCKTGFKPSGSGVRSNTTSFCINRDECEEVEHPNMVLCDGQKTNKKCSDTHGSYQCICKDGFESDENPNRPEDISCRDIDECVVDKHNSEHHCKSLGGSHSYCKNTIGSFTCGCKKGFKADASGNCIDIDECTELTSGELSRIILLS